MVVRTEEELGKAIKNDEDGIEIEGTLINKVVRMKTAGKAAWAVCLGVLAVVIAVIAASGTDGIVVSPDAANGVVNVPIVISILGAATIMSSITITASISGSKDLNKLRKYKLTKKDNRVILDRQNKESVRPSGETPFKEQGTGMPRT